MCLLDAVEMDLIQNEGPAKSQGLLTIMDQR